MERTTPSTNEVDGVAVVPSPENSSVAAFLLFLRQNLLHIADDLVDVLVLQFTFLEGVVGFHFAVGVKNDGDIGVFGDFILGWSGFIGFESKDDVLEFFLLGQFLELFFKAFVIVEENDEAAHFAGIVLGRGGINLLDQTGQGVAGFAREDHRDRVGAVPSDLTPFLAGILPSDVKWAERAGNFFSRLRPGFQDVGGEHAAYQQRARQ